MRTIDFSKISSSEWLSTPHSLVEIGELILAKLEKRIPYSFGKRIPDFRQLKRYVEMGWELVPVSISFLNGKKQTKFPMNWRNRHFSLEDFNENHNAVAIKTGNVSNLMVIDIDFCGNKLNEFIDMYKLDNLIYSYNHPHVSSPRGLHLYFTNEQSYYWKKRYGRTNLTISNTHLHIDVREEGACIFAPSTVIDDYGEYEWLVRPRIKNLSYYIHDLQPLMDMIYPKKESSQQVVAAQKEPIFVEDKANDWLKAMEIVKILSQMRIAYPDWVKIGMAIYAGFGEQGKYLWDYFLSNPNYQDTQRTIDTHWRSFRSVNRVTLASLFYIADKYGIVQ